MGRLLLLLAVLALAVAIVAILVSIWDAAYDGGRRFARPFFGNGPNGEDSLMAPTDFQKIAYVALILLLLGVASGWLGGV